SRAGVLYCLPARGPLNFYAIHGKIIATGSGIPPSPVPLAGRQYKTPALDSSDYQFWVHTPQYIQLFFNMLSFSSKLASLKNFQAK
ncbi:MAG: hypothetical protein KBD78_15985, partial [Oligoflexales bacterium]|nr:hypothetical protein [Oligoflexales bacterium]